MNRRADKQAGGHCVFLKLFSFGSCCCSSALCEESRLSRKSGASSLPASFAFERRSGDASGVGWVCTRGGKDADSAGGRAPGPAGLAGHGPDLRAARLEGVGLRGLQHRDVAGLLGRLVDELRHPEHGTRAVQGLRLRPGAASGPAGLPGAGVRIVGRGSAGAGPERGGRPLHVLPAPRLAGQEPGGPVGGRGLRGGRRPVRHSRQPVGSRHRHGLLRPAALRGAARRAGRLHLRGLDLGGAARHRRRAGVLRLPLLTARPRRLRGVLPSPPFLPALIGKKDQQETGGQKYAAGQGAPSEWAFWHRCGACLPACLPACAGSRASRAVVWLIFGTWEPKIPPLYGCRKLRPTGLRTLDAVSSFNFEIFGCYCLCLWEVAGRAVAYPGGGHPEPVASQSQGTHLDEPLDLFVTNRWHCRAPPPPAHLLAMASLVFCLKDSLPDRSVSICVFASALAFSLLLCILVVFKFFCFGFGFSFQRFVKSTLLPPAVSGSSTTAAFMTQSHQEATMRRSEAPPRRAPKRAGAVVSAHLQRRRAQATPSQGRSRTSFKAQKSREEKTRLIRSAAAPSPKKNIETSEAVAMASTGTQLLGSALCLLGWAGVIVSCLLPMWRVTAFVGSTIVTSQTIWEGIWMSCVVQSTGQIQCKPYESMLALSADLQAARALTVLAAASGAAGLLLAFVGGKCTRFLDRRGSASKGRVAVAAGAVLVLAGVLCLIPTAWAAGAVVRKFYSAAVDAQRREMGACLYIGWGASVLLILGGGLFISAACPLEARGADKSPSVRYLMVRSPTGSLRRVPAARPAGTLFGGPPGYRPASAKSEPTGEAARGHVGQNSDRSWAPSTKSQLKPMDSTPSEQSDAPSAESQLKPDERDLAKTLDSDGSQREESSSNPSKTYL